ncbi:putative histone deacetylase complex subunit SAP30/SAP30 [Helianthus annuus]|nr:putative histone deacetylase complex subunit SAP30/SAP30 [Helianthus annuus]
MDQTYVNNNNGGGTGGDQEELSVLPRHTKVVVTGNNRTKSVLVGLHGVVKKAVGLGGWHWLVLTNGIEVKLQRNALSVIEAPTGNEDDDDDDDDDFELENGQHHLCKSTTGSPRNKTVGRSLFHDSQSRASFTTSRAVKIDLRKLEMAALQRYWLHFNLVTL